MASIVTEGIAEAIGRLVSLTSIPDRAITEMAAIAHETMRQGAGRHSPRINGTGRLYASLYNREIAGGREVGHDPDQAPHAPFVVFGTRPHVILPKNGKCLRWFGPSGKPVFAKKVNHPGYIGDNYRDRAADDAVRGMAAIVDNLMGRV